MVSNEEIKRMLEAKRTGVDIKKEKIESENYKVCPHCKTHNPEKALFCVKCGRKLDKNLKVICPACNTKNEKNAKFCVGCGESLENMDTQELSEDIIVDAEVTKPETVETSEPTSTVSEPIKETETPESKLDEKSLRRSSVPSSIPEHGLINKTGLKKTCPACNGKNLKNAKFCVVCGEKFIDKTDQTIVETVGEEVLVEKIEPSSPDETLREEPSSMDEGNVTSDTESEISEKDQTPEIKVPESIVELKKENMEEDQLEDVTGMGEVEDKSESKNLQIEPDEPETQGNVDPVEKIKKAKELMDMGAITSEEFEDIKKKYLGMI
jgi:ribosomal protein L40E